MTRATVVYHFPLIFLPYKPECKIWKFKNKEGWENKQG